MTKYAFFLGLLFVASACTDNAAELSEFAEAARFIHDVVLRGA